MRDKADKFLQLIINFLASNYFLAFVIVFFVLQALWIAFSFRFPMVYDEYFHIPVIQIFAQQWSPFITSQPVEYDKFGSLAGGAAGLYHYIMSYPYRFIGLFTDDFIYKVIFLRALNVLMVAGGLYLFARLFKKIGIAAIFGNIAILFFTLLPIVPFVSAHVNYDNMLFLLTAGYLLVAVSIVQSKTIEWHNYAYLITIGCFASLIKLTFLPIFAISILFILVVLYRRFGTKKFINRFFVSIKKSSNTTILVISGFLILSVGLFSYNYLRDIVLYGTPSPPCEEFMSKERCMSAYVIRRDANASATKDKRPLMQTTEYTLLWVEGMFHSVSFSAANTTEGRTATSDPLVVVNTVIFVITTLGLIILLYAWRSLYKSTGWYFLGTVSVFLILAVFYVNYSGYIEIHRAFAIQPRYLLSVVPILIVMMIVALNFVLRKSRYLKIVVLTGAVLLFTQGGGVVTHILLSENSWYWQKDSVIEANTKAKHILEPLVEESINE